MPSIVPNFEYDIFISYRHNDNRSGWVTEFVNAYYFTFDYDTLQVFTSIESKLIYT